MRMGSVGDSVDWGNAKQTRHDCRILACEAACFTANARDTTGYHCAFLLSKLAVQAFHHKSL
jgi:hypothetical protein